MGSVTNLAGKRKIRSCEAEKEKEIPTISSIAQDDADYTYIFSKKIDKAIDGCIPYVLFFGMAYMGSQVVRALIMWGR